MYVYIYIYIHIHIYISGAHQRCPKVIATYHPWPLSTTPVTQHPKEEPTIT